MRKIVYKLENGAIVSTLASANKSGMKFVAEYRDILTQPGKLSPIREAMLKKFGYVNKKLLNLL